ncbi:MAG TPA: peptidoglycan-binding domain-containing protein [Gaiellaceae bacterium]|nr:peptidoglycan-binding domain-containing protein [Gaiellaceae bacterium]HUJ54947.1 peptidoglycan-binding domain-containing protein [Gaiellaceae bacterium]
MSHIRFRLTRTRLLAVAAAVVLVAAIGVAVADPFAGNAASPHSSLDNGAPTATRRIVRTSLSSQSELSGTLGYAGSWTVAVPAGTAQSALLQAQQQLASGQAGLSTARATASADEQALAEAKAELHAAALQESSDCAGTGAAGSAGSGSAGSGSGETPSPCANAMQNVSADQTSESAAEQKVSADETQVSSARATLASAQQAVADGQSSATPYGSFASYTMLPTPGKVVRRGQALYAIDGLPTLLLYGGTPAWRAFRAGMSSGRDVAELNANLAALGDGDPGGDVFTSATEQAIVALQRAHGLTPTGTLALGAVAFEPGAVVVTTVAPTVGAAVQPGAVMTVSSTRQDVSIQLDAAQQSEVHVGDRVTVTLPDNSTTAGVVSSVGKVATTPSSDQGDEGGDQGGGSSSPTIDVDVRLLRASAAGTLDQAPVNVSITDQSVHDVLAVPVNALVALAGGGYAVEEVEASGVHQLVAVTLGLFDDARGLVEVSGSGLAVGQRVVVPAE